MNVMLLVVFSRSIVATVLIASAIWKLRHHGEFFRAIAPLPKPIRSIAGMRGVVPGIEIAVGGVLIAPGSVAQVGALGATVLLSAFTVASFASDDSGCGCWAEPSGNSDARTQRRAFIARNTVLIGASVLGAAMRTPLDLAVWSAALPLGALSGLVLLELPQIAVTATYVQSLAREEES